MFPIKSIFIVTTMIAAVSSSAHAENAPYAPCDYPGQYAHCSQVGIGGGDTLTNALRQVFKGTAQARSNAKSSSRSNQKQQQRQRQKQSQRQRQVAHGGNVNGSGNSNVRVDNSTRQAAQTVIAPDLNGYGAANCFGDTNPSGSFSAGFGNALFQATAARSKPSNVCAAYAVAGPRGAIGYLSQVDPAFRSIALANGWAVKK